MKKTREEYIEEYSQLGNAAIPIAIYDVGEKLREQISEVGYAFNSEVRKNLYETKENIKYACSAICSISNNLTDSYQGVFLYLKNFLRK